MVVFPIISISLLLASIVLVNQNKELKKILPPWFSYVLNGVILLALIVFTDLFLKNNDIVTLVPASYYWFLITAGIIIEIFSFRQKYVSGHLTAAAIHCFVGFVAIFSIGLLLLLLALFEISISIYQHRVWRKLIVWRRETSMLIYRDMKKGLYRWLPQRGQT